MRKRTSVSAAPAALAPVKAPNRSFLFFSLSSSSIWNHKHPSGGGHGEQTIDTPPSLARPAAMTTVGSKAEAANGEE